MDANRNLSHILQGVTLVAFGNGSVDIFAAIAGMRQGRPDLVVGALLGGGAFVTLFVIGSIFALSKKFKLQGQIFVRDCVFYLLAISWIFYCFVGPKEIALRDAIGKHFLPRSRNSLKSIKLNSLTANTLFLLQVSYCSTHSTY